MQNAIPTRAARTTKTRRPLWKEVRRSVWCYVFLLPWIALILMFVVYPQLASYPYALYNWDGIGEVAGYVGLDNFRAVIRDPYFWLAFKHTFTYAIILVPIQLFLALVLALVLNNPKLRFANFYRALFFSPTVTSAAIVGIVISFLFNQMGPQFTAVLRFLHLVGPGEQINILADPRFTLYAIIVVGIWKTLGLNMVNFLAALQSIPKELYEAAKIDGATPNDEFWRITIPMLRKPGLIIIFIAFVGSLSVFELVLVMAGTGANALLSNSEVVGTYIYRNAFGGGNNVGFASAAALFMGILTIGLSLLQAVAFRAAGIQRKGLNTRLSGHGEA